MLQQIYGKKICGDNDDKTWGITNGGTHSELPCMRV